MADNIQKKSPQKKRNSRRLGVHTSIAGGIHISLERAYELGCNTMQIFSHNPRGWLVREIPDEEKIQFKKLRVEMDISPVYIHTSYLINMASNSETLRKKSIMLLKEEMHRADMIGADFVILHTGSASNDDERIARSRAVESLKETFNDEKWDAGLLLENTAGERGDITSKISELAEIMDKLDGLISGVCIDTCHAFTAGYDIRKDEGIKKISDEIEKYIGIDKFKLIHLNDSKAEYGFHRDRHEHIGAGKIGMNGLKKFINHKPFSNIPIILETPKEKDSDDKENIEKVLGMLKD
ncbi:MAG: deoxyribonuclease IV [Nitrospiraceae bacterium]|nr:deoxyribonuclease IV [Nitrospiraceae bacterium]